MAEKCTRYGDNPIYYPVPTMEPGPEIGRNLCRVKRRYEGKYGGYRIDILTDNLNERDKVGFICTICESIMKEACTSSSGEQFCSCCRNISSGKETSNVPIRKMINTLKCFCPLIERGCKWLGTLKDCENHLDTCSYVYVSCKLKCGVVLRRNELEEHANECSHRQVKCDHCKKDFKYCELNEHLNKCPKMKVPCDLCDTQITREDMPQHLKHDCGMVQETCKLGCGVKISRNELKAHVKDTCVQREIQCKHCYISVKFCDNSRHLKECPKMKVPCDLCDTQITREDIPQHLKHDCGIVQETCKLGCGVKISRNELKAHVKDTCVQREIQCKHCYIIVKYIYYSRHLRECPYVKVTCEICSEEKYRQDMTEHLKDYCPEKMLECPFVKYKCMTVIKRKDMDNHLEEKKTEHLGLKLTAMEDLISQQSEKIIEQSEEIKKLSENNEKQNKEMRMEKENTSQQFRLLCSVTETTKIILEIENVTNQTKRLLESELYTVAGHRFRFQFHQNSLIIVFLETASKYIKPFIAKCSIVLSTKQIKCGMLEVKQRDFTRGCVRNIISISKQDIDRYSQPSSPGSIIKDLTLEIYLTMQ